MAYNKRTWVDGVTPLSSTNLNNLEKQYDEALKETEQRNYRMYRSGKDANGVFTTVEWKRNDGTLAIKSVLSGGTSPKYTTRTLTYYDTNGTTLLKTTTRTITYDADDDWTQEV